MPHSDNLYSADESDAESFSDELSPTDGYFTRGDVTINVMVPDPSIEDTKVEAKTLIPPHLQESTGTSSRISSHPSSLPAQSYASALSAHNSLPSRSSYTPISPVSSRRLDDLFPRRPASMNGPPPTYSAAPEPATSSSQEPIGRSYSTFPEQHLERGFLPRREPESMGPPEEEPSESTPLSRESRRPSPCRNFLRNLLLTALVLTVMTSLLSAIFRGAKTISPTNPPSGMPPSKGNPIDSTAPYCSSATFKNGVSTFAFPIGFDLTVLQKTHGYDGPGFAKVTTTGEIRLRRLRKDSEHGDQAHFTVDVRASNPSLSVLKTWDHDSRVLVVSTPTVAQLGSSGPHCISLEITAWIPEDAEFTNLSIEAVQLTLRVVEDIRINVTGQSKFNTVSGQVAFPKGNFLGSRNELPTLPEVIRSDSLDASLDSVASTAQTKPPFLSRCIVVETISGSIAGSYPLMDYLGISSQSGSVKVSVFPQDVLSSAPAPAELQIQTTSSSIEVVLPVSDSVKPTYIPPPRNYITRIHSQSGSIKGSFYLGSLSEFKSTSSSIHITGLPVIQTESSSEWETIPKNIFETHTVNGEIHVEVLDPIFITLLSSVDERPEQPPQLDPYLPIEDDDPYLVIHPFMDRAMFKADDSDQSKTKALRNLLSTHDSQSASISVQYPGSWEGTVHAKTISGSIRANGNGLKVVHSKKGFASSELLAKKGVDKDDEGASVKLSAISGSLQFRVGLPV